MSQDMDVFYSRFKQAEDESEDDFTEWRFSMRKAFKKMNALHANEEGQMLSVFKKPLQFRVEPTEKRVFFSGDSMGGRYCHIDLMEKKAVEVQEVMMMDEITNKIAPASTKKQKKYR